MSDRPHVPRSSAHAGVRLHPRRAPLLGVSAALLLVACHGDGPTPPPRTAAAGIDAPGAGARAMADPLSARLPGVAGACVVARRTDAGGYLGRASSIPLPRGLADHQPLARFAYRGWRAGVAEPVTLAICSMPESPAARAFFASAFGGSPMTPAALRNFARLGGVADAEQWGKGTTPHLMQGAPAMYLIDGLAEASPAIRPGSRAAAGRVAGALEGTAAMVVACDPTMIVPDEGCDGYVSEEETVPDDPPPPDGEPSYSLLTDPALTLEPSLAGPIYCEGSTDYPHLSTTIGFSGRINVKSHNSCPVPLPQFVTSTLAREKCFLWVFCSWPAIASGSNSSPSASFITAMANTACVWQKGWYRGIGYHQTTFPQGVGSTRTWSPAVGIRCW